MSWIRQSAAGVAMVAPVILFDYFGVLAHRFGQPDEELMGFIQQELVGHCRLAVLSNMSNSTAEEMLGEYVSVFDAVMISGELGAAKPDQRAFLLAASQMQEFPGDCLMIDDSEINCLSAKDAGMEAIQFKGVADLEQKLEKYGIMTP